MAKQPSKTSLSEHLPSQPQDDGSRVEEVIEDSSVPLLQSAPPNGNGATDGLVHRTQSTTS